MNITRVDNKSRYREDEERERLDMARTVSVGILNVLLKIVVLASVAICGKLIEHCLRLLVKIRVEKSGCAPIVFATDGTVFKIGSFMRRIGSLSFVSIGTLVLLGVCILPAEIATDFGVTFSDKCAPRRESTFGICGGFSVKSMNSRSKYLATAFSIENLEWNNQHLINNPIRQGFHKYCDGTEYFGNGAKHNFSLPIAITGCFVTKPRIIDSNETVLTFGGTWYMSGEGLGLLQIYVDDGHQTNHLEGPGGVFHNYAYHSSFMVVDQPNGADHSSRATIIEYSNSDHLEAILRRYNRSNLERIRVKPRGPLYSYEVGCRVSSLKSTLFADGLFSYRYAQLSRSSKRKAIPRVNLTVGSRTLRNAPQPLNASDVIRATLAAKVSEPISCYGETFKYTECGTYNWSMGYPLLLIFVLLILISLILWLYVSSRGETDLKTPVTEGQWALYGLEKCHHEGICIDMGSEIYSQQYRQYGHRKFMGEFFKDAHNKFFRLRFISFLKAKSPKRRRDHHRVTCDAPEHRF